MESQTKRAGKVLTAISILSILDTAFTLYKSGPNAGTLLPGFLGMAYLFYRLIKKSAFLRSRPVLVTRFERLILGIFLLWAASFILLLAAILVSASSDRNKQADCLVILGAGLHGDQPSIVLRERLNLALDYIKKQPSVKVVVSGGQGIGETITEAESMKRYLIAHGVAETNIFKEEKSTSTMENLKFSKKVFEQNSGVHLQKIMIVTSDFHMFRAKFLAKRIGLTPYGMSAKTPFYLYPNVTIREYLAVAKSFILDRR